MTQRPRTPGQATGSAIGPATGQAGVEIHGAEGRRPTLTFAQFWRLYLDAHRHPGTRGMHYSATAVGATTAALSLALDQVLFVMGGIPLAVMMAVGSHWWIEHNQPLIKVNAFYGALADMRMCWLAVTGGLAREYDRLGLGQPAPLVYRAPAE